MAKATLTWSEQQTTLPFKTWRVHATLMDNAPLTTGYVDSDYVDIRECRTVYLNIAVGPSGSTEPTGLTGLSCRVYTAYNPSGDWFVSTHTSAVSGVISVYPAEYKASYASGMDPFIVAVEPANEYMKVSVAGDGDPTDAAVTISMVGIY